MSIQLMVSKTYYIHKHVTEIIKIHGSYSWKNVEEKPLLATMQNMTLLCMHYAEFIIKYFKLN